MNQGASRWVASWILWTIYRYSSQDEWHPGSPMAPTSAHALDPLLAECRKVIVGQT